MTFDEYQAAAEATNLTPGDLGKVMSVSFMDKVLGLVGESGEFADKVKKILRDDNAQMSEEAVTGLVFTSQAADQGAW